MPDAIAVISQHQQLTYRELNEQANQLANYLLQFGLQPDALIGICLERSLAMIIALLGVLKAGGAYVPLDPDYPQDRLTYMVNDAKIAVLITQVSFLEKFSDDAIPTICIDEDWLKITCESTVNLPTISTPANLAYVIYTSGSTGQPKGVMIQHSALVNFVRAAIATYAFDAHDRVLQFASLSFDAAVEEIYPCLAVGGTLVLRSPEMASSIPQFLQCCHDLAITVLDLPTAYWHLLTAALASTTDLSLKLSPSIRLVIIGGEAVNLERVLLWQNVVGSYPPVVNTYGPTEATVVATAYTIPQLCQNRPSPNPSFEPINRRLGHDGNMPKIPIGRALQNVHTYVVDSDLQPVSVGEPGELLIGGAGIARGYLNRPDLTAEKFISLSLASNPQIRVYRTGDQVRCLPDGNLEFLGRLDGQVKIRGFRVEVGEVEAAILADPDIQDTAVVAALDALGNPCLVAFVVSHVLPDRLPYQTNCFVDIEGQSFQVHTENISKEGVNLVGIGAAIREGQPIQLALPLPQSDKGCQLHGIITWAHPPHAGVHFQLTPAQQDVLRQSVIYLLESQGWVKALQRSIAHQLRKYLKQRLPSYLLPDHYVLLQSLPLTPNGKVDRQYLSSLRPASLNRPINLPEHLSPTEAQLIDIWSELLGTAVGLDDHFFELGGHSLLVTQLIFRVKTTFGVNLSTQDLGTASTVQALAHRIDQLRHTNEVRPDPCALDLGVEATLDPTICLPTPSPQSPSFLLTGANGFLGTYLLMELLQQTSATIYCLVRSLDALGAKQKLERSLKLMGLDQALVGDRIIPVVGDLAKSKLGLEAGQFNYLARTLDAIYHCGALVNFAYPYSVLKAPNVLGTETILRLAAQEQVKPVHYISTLSVFDTPYYYDGRTLYEHHHAEHWQDLFTGYAQSKWVAERLMLSARDRGLPISIYRSPEIVGHSQTGAWPAGDYLTRLLKSCIQLELWPDLEVNYNLTPVDFVSHAIVYLSQQQDAAGKIFHVMNPESTSSRQLYDWLGNFGYTIQLISYPKWQAALIEATKRGQDNALSSLLFFFTETLESAGSLTIQELFVQGRAPEYDCQHTLAKLAQASIHCPLIDPAIFSRYISHLVSINFLNDLKTIVRA
jgi:amino acid adenylation domain-containing protein/thioester reductase-like protein